jgi:hypothetical protein
MNTYKVTRSIPFPVYRTNGDGEPIKEKTKYQIKPVIIFVGAAHAPAAGRIADDMQANFRNDLWNYRPGSKTPTPWNNPNIDWVKVPYEGEALVLS